MRAMLSADFLFSMLFQVLILIVLFAAFFLQANSLTKQTSENFKQSSALVLADRLIYSCPEDFGFAKCDGGFIFANELSDLSFSKFKTLGKTDLMRLYGLAENSSLIVEATDMDGHSYLNFGSVFTGNKICIKRLAVLEDMPIILSVCV